MIQILFLLLLCAFYIIYFLKMLMLKRQGIKGDLLGKGAKPKKAVFIEIFLKTITWLGAVIQFISVLFHGCIWSFTVNLPMQITGIILGFAGVIFFLFAVINMRNNWRAGFDSYQNTKLVTGGIYKISRNPAFVGFDLLYIGCMVAFPNIMNIVITFFAVIGFHFQILGEEKFLEMVHGKLYQEYKNKVRRYF